jgi:acetyl-CoA C-acetyltransferase
MGQTAEVLAYNFNVSREQMDEFALESHQKSAAAQENGYLTEIEPIISDNGYIFEHDEGIRKDNAIDQLAQLKPVFDNNGSVSAGNSAQITDGAACLILASQDAVDKYQLPILAELVDCHWAGLDPAQMALGPVFAVPPLLQRQSLSFDDIDYWEINEAFSAQVLACLSAWQDDHFCQTELGLPAALGTLDRQRLNVDGGAIALGQPVGASGTRIVLHLIHTFRRHNAQTGIATLCIGGGQGGAMLVSREGATQ